MASLTVRQLDEALKQQLRLRAARNGRSVEDEVRSILREAAGETEAPAQPAAPAASAAATTSMRLCTSNKNRRLSTRSARTPA